MAYGLTYLRIATLDLIHRGEVPERRYGHGAWRIVGANPSTVGWLRARGLVDCIAGDEPDTRRFVLTTAGVLARRTTGAFD